MVAQDYFSISALNSSLIISCPLLNTTSPTLTTLYPSLASWRDRLREYRQSTCRGRTNALSKEGRWRDGRGVSRMGRDGGPERV